MLDWEELCDECSAATEKAGRTKVDVDKIVKESREINRKAEKYDLLVEKVEKDIEQAKKIIERKIEKGEY